MQRAGTMYAAASSAEKPVVMDRCNDPLVLPSSIDVGGS